MAAPYDSAAARAAFLAAFAAREDAPAQAAHLGWLPEGSNPIPAEKLWELWKLVQVRVARALGCAAPPRLRRAVT
jgi:hypothetical protein